MKTSALAVAVVAILLGAAWQSSEAADRVQSERREARAHRPDMPRQRQEGAPRARSPFNPERQVNTHRERPAAFETGGRGGERGGHQRSHGSQGSYRGGSRNANMPGGMGSGPSFRTEAPTRNYGGDSRRLDHRHGQSLGGSRGEHGGSRGEVRGDRDRNSGHVGPRWEVRGDDRRHNDHDRPHGGHDRHRGHDHDRDRHNHHNHHNHYGHHNHHGHYRHHVYDYHRHHHYHDHWRGHIGYFRGHDFDTWRHGRWHHGHHHDRFGWWWVVGPTWYFYSGPVYPYPNPYIPPSVAFVPSSDDSATWYYCESPQGYYPYVEQCYTDWIPVAADPSQAPPAY